MALDMLFWELQLSQPSRWSSCKNNTECSSNPSRYLDGQSIVSGVLSEGIQHQCHRELCSIRSLYLSCIHAIHSMLIDDVILRCSNKQYQK